MDFKKLLGDTQKKVKEFLEKDSTKEKIKMVREKGFEIKGKFDEACEQADVKLKAYLDKDKKNEIQVEDAKLDEVNVKKEVKEKTLDNTGENEEPVSKNITKISLSDIGLSAKVLATLKAEGIENLDDVREKGLENIATIKGIGKATIDKIEKNI